jgi:ribosome-associated protein
MALEVEKLAVEIAKALDDKKAADIRVYDVRGISNLTDITVVATGTSAPHLKALIAETQRRMKDFGVTSYRTSGTPDSGWVVVDYIHAVVHVFSTEARAYYAIERLWATAKEIPLPQF